MGFCFTIIGKLHAENEKDLPHRFQPACTFIPGLTETKGVADNPSWGNNHLHCIIIIIDGSCDK